MSSGPKRRFLLGLGGVLMGPYFEVIAFSALRFCILRNAGLARLRTIPHFAAKGGGRCGSDLYYPTLAGYS